MQTRANSNGILGSSLRRGILARHVALQPANDGLPQRPSDEGSRVNVTWRPRSSFSPTEVSPYLTSRRKRVLDVTGAATLIILLLPLLLAVAVLIRLTSPGPVLFRQARCGQGGTPFTIYKFRSMYVAVEPDQTVVQATRADARITPIGRFIRRTSVDELPQLLNVLQGHMSLIGPRPHAIEHDRYYEPQIPLYAQRFTARPGLSGIAQVSGARGETPHVSDMERRVRFDIAYIQSASLATDLRLIAATVRETFFSSSAY